MGKEFTATYPTENGKGCTLHPIVCQAKLSSPLNGDCLHGDAERL
ncbi:hypothetical protein [Capnocytophaga cynodegmi]|nr:hypothetical protein [Capnocytophaga cynodegmi]